VNAPAPRAIRGAEPLRASAARASALRPRGIEGTEPVEDAEHAYPAVLLPAGHPPWTRDVAALTRRARAALAELPRVVIRVMGFWEHPRREALVDGRRVTVDAAGTYLVR